MQKMSYAELFFAVSEASQLLEGKRISRIRRTPEGVFLFKIGAEELLFQPPIRFHITRQHFKASDQPDGFVSFLRKALEGKTAKSISLVENERIVQLSTKSNEKLVFELFRKGNLILLSESNTVLSCLRQDDAGGRKIAKNEQYSLPKPSSFKPKIPAEVAFIVHEEEGSGQPSYFSCDASSAKEKSKKFASMSEALDYYYSRQLQKSKEQEMAEQAISGLKARLDLQKKSLSALEEEQQKARSLADCIMANASFLDEVLEGVRAMKKQGQDDKSINAFLSKWKAKIDGYKIEIDL